MKHVDGELMFRRQARPVRASESRDIESGTVLIPRTQPPIAGVFRFRDWVDFHRETLLGMACDVKQVAGGVGMILDDDVLWTTFTRMVYRTSVNASRRDINAYDADDVRDAYHSRDANNQTYADRSC